MKREPINGMYTVRIHHCDENKGFTAEKGKDVARFLSLNDMPVVEQRELELIKGEKYPCYEIEFKGNSILLRKLKLYLKEAELSYYRLRFLEKV